MVETDLRSLRLIDNLDCNILALVDFSRVGDALLEEATLEGYVPVELTALVLE